MESSFSSVPNPTLLTVGAALVTHQVLRRTETQNPYHLAFLLGVPLVLRISSQIFFLPMQRSSNVIYVEGTNFGLATGETGFGHLLSCIWSITKDLVLYWAVLVGSIVVYRISPWHPLASFSGPMMCKVTKFYMAQLAHGGRQHIYFARLHEKYGDVVRIGPNELIVRDSDAVSSIIGPNGMQKGPFWEGRVGPQERVKPLVAIRDKTEHLRRRRPWTRAFSSLALKGYEPIVIQTCDVLIEVLTSVVQANSKKVEEEQETGNGGKGEESVDLTQWLSYFTYDIMNSIAFGDKASMIRDGDVEGIWRLLDAGQVTAIFFSHVPWLGSLILGSPWFGQDLKAFRAYAKRKAVHRKNNPPQFKDIFHYLMDGDGIAAHPPSVAEVVSDGGLAIIAGADTTSAALSSALYFLMSNPRQYKRLQAEIDALGDDVSDYAKLSQLTYLSAVINETLRLLPPALTGSQRIVEHGSGGRVIGSRYVPEGTIVSLTTYSLHRDPRAFQPFPESFLPERWLAEEQRALLEPHIFNDGAEFVLNHAAFIPFSMGQASCVGKSLAWIEMRMCLALLFRHFEIRFSRDYDPRRWEAEIKDYFITKKGPLPTVLTIRKGA